MQSAGKRRRDSSSAQESIWHKRLGGDGVVAFEGFADLVGGNGAFAANAPVIATEFDNGGRAGVVGLTGIEDERETIAELSEDIDAAGAGGRAGKISAGAGERDAEFSNEIDDDFGLGPAESDAARVGGDFQRKAIGGVDDHGERAGPAGLRETKEIIGEIAGENLGVNERADENGEALGFGASFNAENLVDGGEIDGIGGESVERIGGNGDDGAAI